MDVEVIPVADLHEDPANVRVHPSKNIEAIRASLARFGQQRPILIDGNNVVRAGNGTLQAARSLGWHSLRCVRTELAGSEAVAYAIADNRTSELAEWNDADLARTLAALRDEGFEVEATGFDDGEIDALLKSLDGAADEDDEGRAEGDGVEPNQPEKWLVVIECRDEPHQVELIGRFLGEGLTCRAIVS